MAENNIQAQLDEINRKLDLVLECATSQRLSSNAVEDLIADLSIVGKDAYHSSVAILEKHDVEIDPEEFRILVIRLLKNIKNINSALGVFESSFDFVHDAAPLMKEMAIDGIKKLNELDRKGYFEFFAATGKVIDNIITHFSAEDIKQLADNIVLLLNTVKGLTQPEMLNSVNNAIKVYNGMEKQNIPGYSVFRLIREMNSPEMKRFFGFVLTFMKNFSQTNRIEN
jgi:uncharacterized protein YjgD (DUF1641 family)